MFYRPMKPKVCRKHNASLSMFQTIFQCVQYNETFDDKQNNGVEKTTRNLQKKKTTKNVERKFCRGRWYGRKRAAPSCGRVLLESVTVTRVYRNGTIVKRSRQTISDHFWIAKFSPIPSSSPLNNVQNVFSASPVAQPLSHFTSTYTTHIIVYLSHFLCQQRVFVLYSIYSSQTLYVYWVFILSWTSDQVHNTYGHVQ